MAKKKYITESVTLPLETCEIINKLGAMCDLTGDQMCGALIVMILYEKGIITLPKPSSKSPSPST